MSDQTSNRPEETPANGVSTSRNDSSQHRLITDDGAIVFAGGMEPSDDTPTIISKNQPATSEAIKASAPQQITGSLRGRKLAHFELIEPIGVGGMAAVLRARDTQLDRFVALKILPPDMANDADNVRRFHQEARAAAKLDHENIARVFYCGEDQRLQFIAFEFVEGENLRTFLERRGRLPVGEAVRIVVQIASGLEHAASRGVVHRDVKPSNIIISSNGRAKLVDMGLARSLEPQKDQALTQSGVTLGTFDYISPEQALEPREADSRSDIYSLGCTFYHMLTGHPPVPEGTAAKKLHHHQHVAPVDPRQLNADVPDEVAAILSRMMAKDPKDRYQTPTHLVQHLMLAAQKVGAAGDLSQGPLFVDAPLPSDPRKRPMFLVSLGALALALVLVLLSLAPPHQSQLDKKPVAILPRINEQPIRPDLKKPVPPVVGPKLQVKSEDDLKQLFSGKGPGNQVAYLTRSIDLGEGGLAFHAEGKRNVTLVCDDPDEPKAIRFKYVARPEAVDLVAGLTLEGGTLTFKNIRFEIEAGETPDQTVAALAVRGQGTVHFKNCTFLQKDVPQRAFIPQRKKVVPVACVAIDNPAGGPADRPRVYFEQCHFAGGQVAIGITGPAEVHCTDCAFRPYGACFHLRGDNPKNATALRLERCSAFLVSGPAFRLDQTASCQVQAEHCVFSRPADAPTDNRDDADLIRQTDVADPLVKWEGRRNCYHGLNGLWVRGAFIKSNLEDFRLLAKEAEGSDDNSSQVPKDKAIWATAAHPWKEESVDKAFRLRADESPVRTADLKRAIGIGRFGEQDLAALPAWPEAPIAGIRLRDNEKLVDPDADKSAMGKGVVFQHLDQALSLAQPGDVILIKPGKKSREVEVSPSPLVKAGVDVTVKPYPGSAPILTLGDTLDNDACFFRLVDGKLHFEQLEFVIEPDQANFNAVSVALIGGNASCSFDSCIFTLKPRERRRILSVIAFESEDVKMAPRPAPRARPEIRLHNCFVRGEGSVVHVRASRPLDLEVQNSFLTLNGSLLHVQGNTKDAPPETMAVKLANVSSFLSEPLLYLAAGKSVKGLLPTRVESAKNSLFVALAEKPLVLLEGPDATEDALRTLLDWRGEHNLFSSFDKLIEVRHPDETLPIGSYDQGRWAAAFEKPDSRFSRVMFNLPPNRNLWNAQPDQFQARPEFKQEINEFGASLNLNALLQLKKPDAPQE